MRKFKDLDNGHYFNWNGTLPKCLKGQRPLICQKVTAKSFIIHGEDTVYKLNPDDIFLEADRRSKP